MAAPNVDPRWATDTTYTVDGDDWGGDPTRIDPGVGRRAEGAEPTSFPAEWLNWILGTLGDWVYWFSQRLGGLTGSGEWTYETAKTRTIFIPGSAMPRHTLGAATGWGQTPSGSVGYPRTMQAEAAGDQTTVDLGQWLSDGDSLTAILVFCTVPTTTTPLSFKIYKTAHSTGTATQIGTTQSAGTASGDYLPTNTFSAETIDMGAYAYTMTITASDAPAPGGIPSEYVNYARLYVTRPGPRR